MNHCATPEYLTLKKKIRSNVTLICDLAAEGFETLLRLDIPCWTESQWAQNRAAAVRLVVFSR